MRYRTSKRFEHQPYAAPFDSSARQPGMPLDAMMRGRTLYGQNPMDAQREAFKRAKLRGLLKFL